MKVKYIAGFFFAVLLSAFSGFAAQNPDRDIEPQPADEGAYSQNQPVGVVPPVLTLPPGTLVTVRTTQPLSSDRNRPGDSFTTVLDQPVIVQGWVVARRGQVVMGRIVEAQKTGRGNSSSRLVIELDELSLVDGQPLPIHTELAEIASGSPSRSRNEGAAVGATTGAGAVIGAIAGGGTGAAIGAAVGAAVGVAGVLTTRGKATEIRPESQLTFRLENAVTISTAQSRHAFLPVKPDDYNNRRPTRNPERYPAARNYPPPPPGYYAYDYAYDYGYAYAPYYWYPRSYFSLYVGPGYRVGSRGYIGSGRSRWRR